MTACGAWCRLRETTTTSSTKKATTKRNSSSRLEQSRRKTRTKTPSSRRTLWRRGAHWSTRISSKSSRSRSAYAATPSRKWTSRRPVRRRTSTPPSEGSNSGCRPKGNDQRTTTASSSRTPTTTSLSGTNPAPTPRRRLRSLRWRASLPSGTRRATRSTPCRPSTARDRKTPSSSRGFSPDPCSRKRSRRASSAGSTGPPLLSSSSSSVGRSRPQGQHRGGRKAGWSWRRQRSWRPNCCATAAGAARRRVRTRVFSTTTTSTAPFRRCWTSRTTTRATRRPSRRTRPSPVCSTRRCPPRAARSSP
mmetsp:Transcript_6585/g.20547  ORF Transcript_6585/g.20547 Transcript_6585/m.20547 type:complete len:305 (-) Transcript_6585:783-1697(-)